MTGANFLTTRRTACRGTIQFIIECLLSWGCLDAPAVAQHGSRACRQTGSPRRTRAALWQRPKACSHSRSRQPPVFTNWARSTFR